MLRLAERDYDLSIKALSLETGIPGVTLNSWKRDVMMPLGGFVALCRVIPDDLTSLMLEPADKHIGTNERDENDLDALTAEASGLVTGVLEAKRDGKVTPIERAHIQDKARRVAAKARAVAA